MLWGDCCVQLGCPYLCWSLCPHFISLRSLYIHPLATGHKYVLWKVLQHWRCHFRCSHCDLDWSSAGNHSAARLCSHKRGNKVVTFSPSETQKAEGRTTECLETTEGCGNTYWGTTVGRTLWNPKGTNYWPPQHTYKTILRKAVRASLLGCEMWSLWVYLPDIPTPSRMSEFFD